MLWIEKGEPFQPRLSPKQAEETVITGSFVEISRKVSSIIRKDSEEPSDISDTCRRFNSILKTAFLF